MASAAGGMDIEEVAETHPEKIFRIAVDHHLGASAVPETILISALAPPDSGRSYGRDGRRFLSGAARRSAC
jgi:succinyl-CoA synthetase beta subunit